MATLLQTINATFSRELIGHLAARLGESEGGVSNALSGLVPLVLGGIISKAGTGGFQAIHEHSLKAFQSTTRKPLSVTDLLGILGSGTDASGVMVQGEILLAALFKAADGDIAEAVGTYAGIKAESAGMLLRLVGAVLPALLGQYADTYHLRPQALAVALLGLRGAVRGMLPRGLQGLAGLLWPGGIGTASARSTRGSLQLSAAGAKAPWAAHVRRYQTLLALIGSVFLLTLVLGYILHKQGNESACASFLRSGPLSRPASR